VTRSRALDVLEDEGGAGGRPSHVVEDDPTVDVSERLVGVRAIDPHVTERRWLQLRLKPLTGLVWCFWFATSSPAVVLILVNAIASLVNFTRVSVVLVSRGKRGTDHPDARRATPALCTSSERQRSRWWSHG
jgi:hypothetical protein